MYTNNVRHKSLKWPKGRGSKLLSALTAIITSYDYEIKPDGIGDGFSYVLQTRFGPLELHEGLNTFPVCEVTIFGRFTGTEEQRQGARKATQRTNVWTSANPNSGKWNFNYAWCPKENEKDEIFEDFRLALKDVMG